MHRNRFLKISCSACLGFLIVKMFKRLFIHTFEFHNELLFDLPPVDGDRSNCCGPSCRDFVHLTSGSHYDSKYFQWQMKLGLQAARMTDYNTLMQANPTDTVLDFGAGTGAILATLKVHRKIAVEYNTHARTFMQTHYPEIISYQFPEMVPPNSVDIVFSTSVIEHVECPIQELRALYKTLKPGGRVVIGIKNEGVELWRQWLHDNRDNHLYTWNSMLLGNTLRAAGFVIDKLLVRGKTKQGIEKFVIDSAFGVNNHTFQYIFAFGHRPAPDEQWPQKTNANLVFA